MLSARVFSLGSLVMLLSPALVACDGEADSAVDAGSPPDAAISDMMTDTAASGVFTLGSALLEPGGALPADLKCERDGGDGASPPIAWANVPADTVGFAVSMHHFPEGSDPERDTPSHYWLVWNLSEDLRALPRGNPDSLGDEGSDKDGLAIGYTPPCSPPGVQHAYTITVYALSGQPEALGGEDDLSVDWAAFRDGIDGLVLAEASLTFVN